MRTPDSIPANIDWEALCTEHMTGIHNFFRYRFTDEATAQDLTSATFEKAWHGRTGFRGTAAQTQAWLYTIARNVARDYMRRQPRSQSLEEMADYASPDHVEDVAQRRHDLATLRRLFAELSDRERELIALKYGSGMNNRQIAALTQLSESNVGTLLHRTVSQLRQRWEE